MSLFDPRYDQVSHSGVKGMRWGIRKKIYERQQGLESQYKTEAKQAKEAAAMYEKGGKVEMTKSHKKVLEKAALNLQGLDDSGARTIGNAARGKIEDRAALVKALKNSAKVSNNNVRAMSEITRKNKPKLDAINKKLEEQLAKNLEKDDFRSARNGKEFVNVLLTGNKYGNITKGVVAQYLILAGGVGYIAAKK